MKFFDLEISETILSDKVPELPPIKYNELVMTSLGVQCQPSSTTGGPWRGGNKDKSKK